MAIPTPTTKIAPPLGIMHLFILTASIALMLGISTLATAALYLLVFNFSDMPSLLNGGWIWLLYLGSTSGMAVILMIPFFRLSGSWRWFFGLLSFKAFFTNLGVQLVLLSIATITGDRVAIAQRHS